MDYIMQLLRSRFQRRSDSIRQGVGSLSDLISKMLFVKSCFPNKFTSLQNMTPNSCYYAYKYKPPSELDPGLGPNVPPRSSRTTTTSTTIATSTWTFVSMTDQAMPLSNKLSQLTLMPIMIITTQMIREKHTKPRTRYGDRTTAILCRRTCFPRVPLECVTSYSAHMLTMAGIPLTRLMTAPTNEKYKTSWSCGYFNINAWSGFDSQTLDWDRIVW